MSMSAADWVRNSLVVDLFAGCGGASLGIEHGLGRPIDVAINHSPAAIACHRANHPRTVHLCEDVFDIDPVAATSGRPVALLWASPDCTHHSKAKGGKPLSKKLRALAWVVVRWASRARPQVIILENVEEFEQWGPLTPENLPDKARLGETFRQWVGHLRNGLGYDVEWRQLRACDYGAPTIRKRLFLVARCDGRPIVWPEATHAAPDQAEPLGMRPWRTAAECIDWSLPCPSIFLTRDEGQAIGVRRPLAENTMRRIANGVRRYVIEAAEPFIVRTGHYSNITGEGAAFRGQPLTAPMGTITSVNEKALIVPTLGAYYGPKSGADGRTPPISEPLRTQTTENRFSLVAAFLAKHNFGDKPCSGPAEPIHTVTTQTDRFGLTAAWLAKLRGTCADGQDLREPAPTATAGGNHEAAVAAFMVKYYGSAGHGQDLSEPAHTITARHRLGLVTVAGQDYRIVDIEMRMLTPRELARAQGLPDEYRIETGPDGRTLSKREQVLLIGNSVCPQVAAALARANVRADRRASVEVA